MTEKTGLVLAGGGGKGSYQIGVWKALKQLGIDKEISCVSGTSVGALNAVLFSYCSFEQAEQVWYDIHPSDILTIDLNHLMTFRPSCISPSTFIRFCFDTGYFSRRGLLRLLRRVIPLSHPQQIEVYACCSDVTSRPPNGRAVLSVMAYSQGKSYGEVKYFLLNRYDEKKVRKILLASSAIPIVFRPEKIDGRVFYDGGLTSAVPVTPLYTLAQCSKIIVVYTDQKQRLDASLFPEAQLIEIVPSKSLGDLLTGTFDFSDEGVYQRIALGYKDGMFHLNRQNTQINDT